MTPIEKNIIVVDELGNRYEDTYLKRAKGLVKHGRARFVDDHTICLACPPTNELEDNLMSENINVNTTAETANETVAEPTVNAAKYTIDYCLEQIETITRQTAYLTQAMEELKSIESVTRDDGAGAAKAMAIGNIIEAREKTNQRLITFYEKVYDDLKPEKPKDFASFVNHRHAKSSSEAQAELLKDLCAQLSDPTLDKDTREILKNGIEKAMSNMFR